MRTIVALIGGVSTTVGQWLLLYLIWPNWMAANGVWVLLGLLVFNCGVAGLLLKFDRR